MPRVNRDLQRRMAARRERERRRPSARYRFGTTEPDLAPEEQVLEEELEDDAAEGQAAQRSLAPRSDVQPSARRAAPRDGASRSVATARPFTAYRSEYNYVLSDLRRIVLVVGSLLVVLIVLYFILPH